jgi:hypothetical protein
MNEISNNIENNLYDKIWYEDILNVFKLENLVKFIPKTDYIIEEQLNAIWLFSLYFSVLVFLYNGNINIFLLFIFVSVFTYIFYNYIKSTNKYKQNYINKNDLESYTEHLNKNLDERYIRKPTIDNPFMNANIVTKEDPDFMNDNIFDNKIQNQVNNLYNQRIVRDIGDVYDKLHSQRQFYTMPATTIPNQQDEYAQWLYGSSASCKDNQRYCLRYEDPRFISY